MNLSSLRRLRLYCAGQQTDPITDNTQNNRLLESWLGAVSKQIEHYLAVSLHVESRTEYFDITYMKDEYWPKARPIASITSAYEDSTGLWDGSESELDDYYIGSDSRSVVLDYPLSYEARKALRVIYTAGFAYHGVNSVFTLSDVTGAIAVAKWAVGGTSGARGYTNAWDSENNRITVENYYGIFEADETISLYDNEDGTGSASGAGTISAIYRQSLAEAYPDISMACEAQVRYYWKHMTDFENAGTNKDGTTLRRSEIKGILPLKKEVINLLQPHRRMVL